MTPPSRPGRQVPGFDVPDARGRTRLDTAGRDLTGNPDVVVRDVELLAAGWHVLRRTTFDYRHSDGRWTREQRETYDRGNGATILLYDRTRRTVLLTRQFRYPVYVNGHPDGMLVETAAGLLDDDDPTTAIRREATEELGVHVGELEHVFDVWMSPGSVTERLHFYAAPYTPADRIGSGGGLPEDGEDIDVLELDIDEALQRVRTGRITDAKTIVLLQWAVLDGPFRPRELTTFEAPQPTLPDGPVLVEKAEQPRRRTTTAVDDAGADLTPQASALTGSAGALRRTALDERLTARVVGDPVLADIPRRVARRYVVGETLPEAPSAPR